jgi:thioredoxin-like negative regulator of GroEL
MLERRSRQAAQPGEAVVISHAQVADSARPAQGAARGQSSKPTLVFFYTPTSGGSRRADGFLAQVLQRRRNHDTFTLQRVNYEARPELAARLGVESAPAIVVIEQRRVRARLERPRGCADLQAALAPWLK